MTTICFLIQIFASLRIRKIVQVASSKNQLGGLIILAAFFSVLRDYRGIQNENREVQNKSCAVAKLRPTLQPHDCSVPRLILCCAQVLSCVRLFVTPWAAACQASLSFPIFWSLLKLMSTECHPSSASSVIPVSSCGVLQILLLASSPSSSFRNLFNVHILGSDSEPTESNTLCCCFFPVAKSCPTLQPRGLQPGSSVHYLPEFAQIHVH